MQAVCIVGQCLKNYLLIALNGKKNMLKFNEDSIKNHDEDNDKGYILETDVKYPKRLHNLHCDLPFLPERMKINKCNKLVYNLYDKKNCCSHKIFKLSIRFDRNTELRKEAKNNFEKDFFKLMNNSIFGKTMENVDDDYTMTEMGCTLIIDPFFIIFSLLS